MTNMVVDQIVDLTTVLTWLVPQSQELSDFIQAHVQSAAVADKQQPLQMDLVVYPVVAFGARRLRQQAFLFPIADSFHRATYLFRQFTDFHVKSPHDMLDPIV